MTTPGEARSQPSPPAAAKPAFELLHPGVQRQLWQMRWTNLRPLQVEAIRALARPSGDVILSAATASGKTEAAFLPILSQIADEPTGSVRAIYVGPLKALINDPFSRVEELCTYLDIPVHRWHGDVPASKKAKLIESPGGVLLITPESLESIFVNKSGHLRSLFGGLRFIVIDELHSFLSSERGLHLRSLLCRLVPKFESPAQCRVAGLSATLGEPGDAQRFVRPDDPDRAALLRDTGPEKEIKFKIHAYRVQPYRPEADVDDDAVNEPPANEGGTAGDNARALVEDLIPLASDIVTHCAGSANLVFANVKALVEEYADTCAEVAKKRGLRDLFLVHHGSLSAEIREDTEQTMKGGALATTFCSSTLEMGIDIGSVRAVGQIGAPYSVASFAQRMGRSGRRDGEPRIMRMYVQCEEPDAKSSLFDRLHLELIRGIALTELMLSGWVEPASPPVCDLSTLTQQIISVIAEIGGIRALELYHRLCVAGAFRDVEKPLFVRLLRNLAARDVIEQVPGQHDLILGLVGERLRKEKGFYAVFPTPEEFTVLNDAQVIGTIQTAYDEGEHLLLAGRRWQVLQLDRERREIHVAPAKGKKLPLFGGKGGDVHPRVRQMMMQVLSSADAYGYLDSNAKALLGEARGVAAAARIFDSPVVPLGPSAAALFTWTGTKIQRTLDTALAVGGIKARDEGVAFTCELDPDQLRERVGRYLATALDATALARASTPARHRKYDYLLDDDLIVESWVRGSLDVAGAGEVLRSIGLAVASS
jgi:ATP-dependent Lhr-like helicase